MANWCLINGLMCDRALSSGYCCQTACTNPVIRRVSRVAYRVAELDELYTKIYALTGFTPEELLEKFAAGYTLVPPEKPASLSDIGF